MIKNRKSFWLTLSLVNLSIVAFLGFLLRSKILFPLPFLDYRNLISSHSHFAFAGWVGLALITLLIYDVLPQQFHQRKMYQWLLWGTEISSLGMAFFFPFFGYNFITISFSTLYIIVMLVFVPLFINDVSRSSVNKNVKLLSISALISLVLSFAGVVGLSYIMSTGSGGRYLYRDSIYTFLHFQYNGFFTLAVFALFLNYFMNKGIVAGGHTRFFSIFLCLSVLPALFLSLLWHNNNLYYWFAAIACFFILLALFHFFRFVREVSFRKIFSIKIAGFFCVFALVSFTLKMIMQVGTIFPQLGNAVYGDRPVIIGFLHLVFLGFVTFYLLSTLTEQGYFSKANRVLARPLIIFSAGIFANEILLMLQGLGILFNTNNDVYKWLLWGAAIILLTGAVLIVAARFNVISFERKVKSHSNSYGLSKINDAT